MTHDELLERVSEYISSECDCESCKFINGPYKALRTVVELHKLIDAAEGLSQASRDILGYTNVCGECHYDGGPYPCNTIKAIEKELT